MPITLLSEGRVTEIPDARDDGDALWVPIDNLESATGWHLEPEGMCRGERCVTLPHDRDLANDKEVDLAGFARHMRQAVARSGDGSTWAIGAEQPSRLSLGLHQAPDFTLPDLEGNQHGLADWRGRKVLLVTWGSW